MIVMVADEPEQIVVEVEIAAVGSGTTVTVMVPVCGCVQAGVPVSVALTNVQTVVTV